MRSLRLRLWLWFGLASVVAAFLLTMGGCGSTMGMWSPPDERLYGPETVGRWQPSPAGAARAQIEMGPPQALALAPALPGEEVWFITPPPRTPPEGAAARPGDDDQPGSGAMLAQLPGAERLVPMPLQHTGVKASVAGYLAAVDVTQQFANPYTGKIEAVYVFPLPTTAAIHEFVMTIGDRRIRGIIRERAEAQRLYLQARAQGYVASLLTQERPNVFTQKVANLEPGQRIDVHIRYYQTLDCADGWYEFAFPMVVGPRYNPAGSSAGVGAVGRGRQGITGQPTEVTYLRPGERSGHDIALEVELGGGVPVEEVACTSHRITSTRRGAGSSITVALDPAETIPNKDFVLRYRVAAEQVRSSLVLHQDARGGFFTLMIFPPRDLQALAREPLELVFLLDCSGSMEGDPLAKVKQAVIAALRDLDERDSFQIVCFANVPTAMTDGPLPATRGNRARGIEYVRALTAGGGTEMRSGIQAALARPRDFGRRRVVALLTDGFVGNEAEIIADVRESRGETRICTFGVGASPNRYLIEGVARAGGGAVAYVGLHDQAEPVMQRYLERIGHPALTDVMLDWGGLAVSGVYPSVRRLPDLFVGRPVIVTGRCAGRPRGPIQVTGRAGGQFVHYPVAIVQEAGEVAAHPGAEHGQGLNPGMDARGAPWCAAQALPAIWARLQIADLAAQALHTPDPHQELAQQIKQTALDYGLLSPYTAFIAVDSKTRTAGDHGTSVPVGVPVPEGTRYDTTVEE